MSESKIKELESYRIKLYDKLTKDIIKCELNQNKIDELVKNYRDDIKLVDDNIRRLRNKI